MGGGGFWENGCPLFRTFQNIIVTKIYLISFEIKVELLPCMGGQRSVNGETTKMSSNFQVQLKESEITCQ